MSIGFEILESKNIPGVFVLEPTVAIDNRGNIWTSYLKEAVDGLLPLDLTFKHDKFSYSKHGVLRGIHGDTKSWKLVTCVFGEVDQVVVDLREDSDTFLQWERFSISQQKQKMILIPPGMGNAYYVGGKEAVYHYKLAYHGDYIDANEQFSVKWNDERIGIEWPTASPILSDRDK